LVDRKIIMNTEIEVIKSRFLKLYQDQYRYLDSKPSQFLDNLQHEAAERMATAEDFSEVAAAKINHAAATVILQKRGVQ
jgi:hypothetical protein